MNFFLCDAMCCVCGLQSGAETMYRSHGGVQSCGRCCMGTECLGSHLISYSVVVNDGHPNCAKPARKPFFGFNETFYAHDMGGCWCMCRS